MTGNSTVFSELDRHIAGTVRFCDGSVVEIEGRGMVVFVAHGGCHRVLSKVYYIPRLRTSIISSDSWTRRAAPLWCGAA